MDSSNVKYPAPVQTPPQVPQANTPFIPESPKEGNSSKLILFLFIGLILIAIVVGGGYWYMSKGQQAPRAEVNQSPLPVVQQKAQEESIDKQFNSIDIATDDADFAEVDQDLQGL